MAQITRKHYNYVTITKGVVMKAVKLDPALLQMGDQVVIQDKVWTLSTTLGPDLHGTYDLFLHDRDGNGKATIANEPVTIIM